MLRKYLEKFKEIEHVTLIGPFFKGTVSKNEPLVFVDRGADYRQSKIGFAVGDGDSSTSKMDQLLEVEKKYSDLAYALGEFSENFVRVRLLGFLGGRKDHELINWLEVHQFLKKRHNTKVEFDECVRAYSGGLWSEEIHGCFSLVAFEPVHFSLSGACKYQLRESSTLDHLSSHGLSNEGSGLVSFSSDAPVFLFL